MNAQKIFFMILHSLVLISILLYDLCYYHRISLISLKVTWRVEDMKPICPEIIGNLWHFSPPWCVIEGEDSFQQDVVEGAKITFYKSLNDWIPRFLFTVLKWANYNSFKRWFCAASNVILVQKVLYLYCFIRILPVSITQSVWTRSRQLKKLQQFIAWQNSFCQRQNASLCQGPK